MGEFVHEPIKIRISIPYSLMVHLNPSLTGFQSQRFGGLLSLVQIPRVEVPNLDANPLLLREEGHICEVPPNCGSPYHSQGFW